MVAKDLLELHEVKILLPIDIMIESARPRHSELRADLVSMTSNHFEGNFDNI